MKKALLFFSLLLSSVTLSQLQIDEHHLTNYDYQTGDLQYRDSSRYEYSYVGQGIIHSNKPFYSWDFDLAPFVSFESPLLSFTKAKNYSVYPGNTNLSTITNQIMNTFNLPEEANMVDQNASPTNKIEYAYNSSGKPTAIMNYDYNGSTYDLVYTSRKSYNAQNQLVMNGYHQSNIAIAPLTNLDSTIYDGSSKVIRKTGYTLNNGTYLKTYESIPVYSNGIVNYVDIFVDSTANQTGQMTKLYRITYTFSSGELASFILQEYQNGVLNPSILQYTTYDYSSDGPTRSSEIANGDTVLRLVYTYSSPGFVENIQYYTNFQNDGWKLLEDEHFTYGPLSASLEEKTPLTITVFPNPTKDIIAISNVVAGNVDITNSMGQIVLRQNGNLSNIDVRNLASGIYTIRFYSDQGVGTTSFVKE